MDVQAPLHLANDEASVRWRCMIVAMGQAPALVSLLERPDNQRALFTLADTLAAYVLHGKHDG